MLLPWWLMLYPPMGELADCYSQGQYQHQKFYYSGKRGPEPNKSNQRGSIHKGQ